MPRSDPPPEETALAPFALMPVYRSRPRVRWTDAGGKHSKLLDGRTLVGSSASAGITVQDPTMSRLHAEFEPREDGVWVRDVGSRNGTFVDGLQVTGARIPEGVKVRLGSTEMMFDYAEPKRPLDIWPQDHFGRLIGGSVAMRELFATLSQIAKLDAPVFIQGETGTGKELIARAIHDASPRAAKPFVVVDCAALPETLLDAELFGHTKGAFTGAIATRIGAIESAEGGTVFLDEVGELPLGVQPKLLRVLESRTLRRVGESSYRDINVRFVSATHRDLLTMVNAGEFREDLYFRLSVLPVTVPPLRNRLEDIELLVNHFWRISGGEGTVTPDLSRALLKRPWRGNVRELRNFMERARALGLPQALALTENTKPSSEPPPPPQGASSSGESMNVVVPKRLFQLAFKDFREAWIDAGERDYLAQLLGRHSNNVAAAARDAQIDRTYIYRLIRKHQF